MRRTMKIGQFKKSFDDINDQSFENKVQMMKIAIEEVGRYKSMSHHKKKSKKNTSVA